MKLVSIVFPIDPEREELTIKRLKNVLLDEFGIVNNKIAIHSKPFGFER